MTEETKSCGCSTKVYHVFFAVLMIAAVGILCMNANREAVPKIVQIDSMGLQKDTITVSGNAQITVAPDEAIAYISVVTDNATAKDSQENNRVVSDVVMSSLKGIGISPADIETDSYSLTKLEEYDQESGKYLERGFRLTNTIKVTTRDIKNVGGIVDAAVGAGANGVDSVTFQLTKESEKTVRDQAMVKATQAAMSKAQSLAKTAGVGVGKAVSIQEQNFYYAPYEFNVRNTMVAGDAKLAPTVISPQKVEVTSSVQLIYAIK
ncbi:MAG: SIMPL domain-containing protein [Candidatus Altiarchaeota archaeon]